MIAGFSREWRMDDAGVADEEVAAGESFVERTEGKVGREGTETRDRVRNLVEAVMCQCGAVEAVAPVVVVANEERGQLVGWRKDSRPLFLEQAMVEEMLDLPVTLGIAEAEVKVHQVQVAFGRVDDHELRAARFFAVVPERDLMLGRDRPP